MVEVLAEAGAAVENITRFAHSQGYQVSKTADGIKTFSVGYEEENTASCPMPRISAGPPACRISATRSARTTSSVLPAGAVLHG